MAKLEDNRPDPDALLAGLSREQRDGLKVFLGAAPGVGKTYAMLLAAQEAHREGHDIVIGVVESHGRRETEALCDGIEAISLLPVTYRERQFEEFNLDAVLARKPAIVVIDELAHRNIPGTRHPRRYQDIQELLAAGIDVWTTVNVQHVESLNDTVAKITGVRMRETVPDSLLENARDIVLIDLTPRELIERLEHGKVYVPEQVRAALDGYFNPSNLTALREMAFAAASAHVDADLRQAMQRQGKQGPWPARDRVVVAIDGRLNSEQVVRAGKRLAERRRAPWTVVFVDTGRVRNPTTQATLDRAFQLAERLSGETATLRGAQIDAEILSYAREQNASAVVIGRTRERPLMGVLGRTLTQKLLRHNTDFEITVIGSEPEQAATLMRRWEGWIKRLRRTPVGHYVLAAWAVVLCVLISLVLEGLLPLPLPNLSLVFLTGVLIVAARTSLIPALAAAGMSFLAYNFFFIEPRWTFTIYETDQIVTVFFFLVMAIIGSQLASRLRAQLSALRATNDQSQMLLTLNKKLAESPDPNAVWRAAVETIAAFERAPVCLLTADPANNGLDIAASAPQAIVLDDKERAAANWTYKHARASGYQSDTLTSVGWRFLPLNLGETCYGVLGVKLAELPNHAPPEQLLLLDALANQVVLTLARTRLTASLEQARVAEETERLRSSLLSSVSHDLRTPLASMIGSASSLKELAAQLSDADKQELLDAVLSEGQRLNRYIENLLDMTRLGHGGLKLQRDWVAVADIVASALRRTRELFTEINVVRDIQDNLPLLYAHHVN